MSDNQAFVISKVEESQEALQARFQQLGYLFFRNYVNADSCDELLAALVAQTEGQVSLDDATGLPCLKGRPLAGSTHVYRAWNRFTVFSIASQYWTSCDWLPAPGCLSTR